MRNLTENITTSLVSQETKNKGKKYLLDYVFERLHSQNMYAIKFIICEILNLINVIIQVVLMNLFLAGQFILYGPKVFSYTFINPEERDDHLNIVFPKLTKCEIYKYGPSGSIEDFDALCVLPLNIVNEKIYILLWFWCFALIILSFLFLIYRMITLFSTNARKYLLKSQCLLLNKTIGMSKNIDIIVDSIKYGDWFVLIQLGKNVNPVVFIEFLSDLAEQFIIRNEECKRNV